MFARTRRLTLRPGWLEDADAIAAAIAHEDVIFKLSRPPWPYAVEDARDWLSRPQAADDVALSIFAHEGDPRPRLVGCIGIHREDGAHELGYWLTPSAWGRGYATEAGQAMLGIARHAMGLKRLAARHFVDNPASGRVLTKLGFRPTGIVAPLHCRALAAERPCAFFVRDLTGGDLTGGDADGGSDVPARMAA